MRTVVSVVSAVLTVVKRTAATAAVRYAARTAARPPLLPFCYAAAFTVLLAAFLLAAAPTVAHARRAQAHYGFMGTFTQAGALNSGGVTATTAGTLDLNEGYGLGVVGESVDSLIDNGESVLFTFNSGPATRVIVRPTFAWSATPTPTATTIEAFGPSGELLGVFTFYLNTDTPSFFWDNDLSARVNNVPILAFRITGGLNSGTNVNSITYTPGSGGPPIHKWTPVDIATNRTDNTSRLLWRETTNRYAVWKLSPSGAIQAGKYYGPVTGYACDQIVVAPNGQTTLLWKNAASKQAALWTLSADLSAIVKATVYSYPANHTPQNIAADAASNIRLTWRKSNNAIALWTITPATGAVSASARYGPYAYYHDGPLAVGADGHIRLLWRHGLNGQAVVWTIPATGGAPSAGYTYGPVAGATATDLAVGADNKTRLQWMYPDDKIALWKINTAVGGTGAIETGKFYGPIAGVRPLGLSVGGDNQTRQLWKYGAGKVALWVLSDSLSAINGAYTYGPIP